MLKEVLAMILLDLTPKKKTIKTKINKWVYIKLKSFCTGRNLSTKMKRQLMEWEKVFANHISDKGLIYKKYKELIQFKNNDKMTLLKMGRGSE